MKERRYRIQAFLTAVFGTFAGGILPFTGCTGGCGACFQCAGAGGILAVLAVIGTARKKKQGEKDHGLVDADY